MPHILPDVLDYNLKVVFCGTAAGHVSARKGQYYAGPGNRFWTTLHEIGLVDRILSPGEFKILLKYGVGLTDLVKGQSGMDSNIEFRNTGAGELTQKIKKYKPKILCFNGKRAAREFFGQKVKYGLQDDSIDHTKIFVAPSTSRAANRFWDIKIWHKLARLCSDS